MYVKSRISILIISLFLYSAVFAGGNIKIISSSSSSVVLQYSPVNIQSSVVKLTSGKFIRISIDNAQTDPSVKIGEPGILVSVVNVGVPGEFGNTIQIIGSEFKTLKGKLLPKPDLIKENGLAVENYEPGNDYSNFTNPDLVTFGDFGLVRELKVQKILIHPIRFLPNDNTIKVFTKIIFRVNFGNTANNRSLINDDLLKNVIINYNVARNWGTKKSTLQKGGINSVLANGTWYTFEAPEEGIYKITRDMLPKLGIDPETVDPRTIKIYNNGGYILPWKVTAQRPDGLVENAIYIRGEEDGKFDADDYILFYGRGVDFWFFNSSKSKIVRNKNWYSKANYYWITSGGNPGKRMQLKTSNNDPNPKIQTITKAFKFLDEDKRNLIRSGLIDVGDEFSLSSKSRSYVNEVKNYVADSLLKVSYQFINASKKISNISLYENGKLISSQNVSGPRVQPDYTIGKILFAHASYSGALPDDRSVLKFTFNPTSSSAKGYLDFYEIEYYSSLYAVAGNLLFFSNPVGGNTQYKLSGFPSSNVQVFDVSDYSNVKLISGLTVNGPQITFQVNEQSGKISKYYAVETSKFKKPENFKKMKNSNIHGIDPGAKYIIVTNEKFKDQAERLKEYRQNEAPHKLSSVVVYVDEIFNEYSSGMLDPTAIRNFLQDALNNWQVKPQFVLFFGDGDFDYYNLLGKNKNFVPTFQTLQSMNEIISYAMDDYYSRLIGDDNSADIAIGRLPVSSLEEAESVVNKIIFYEKNSEKGLWRNTITLVADDGLTSKRDDGSLHTDQSERLSKNNIPPFFDQNKIYLSNYPTVITGLGRRKPEVNKAIINAINNGTLILNYIGHGSPELWAHEQVFVRETSIPQLRNKDYFFLTAATCDFGKFDDPENQSGVEEMLVLNNYGMIGALSAVRPVYSQENAALNGVFYRKLLGPKDSQGLPYPIGTAFYQMKQNRTGENDEKFHLFCDPALRLNQPVLPADIDSVNHTSITTNIQIKALGNVVITGEVKNLDGTPNDFNGESIITVFDSDKQIYLKDINYNMVVHGGVIFRGRTKVNNGKFSTGFVVPKDISYGNKNGKIVSYVYNDNTDGVGFTKNIIVGGTDSTISNDGKGPDIKIYYDNFNNADSYLVNPDFTLLVKIQDETGINTTGLGVGHKLEAIINDDDENPIDLTNFFIGDVDSFGKSGVINYKFTGMDPGDYKIKIKAWDVFNNVSISESRFTVVNSNDLVIKDVFNYPNPFKTNTYFTFQQNLDKPLNVEIKVYTISGRLIKIISKFNVTDRFVKINWDGKDEDGTMISNGTYLYKLIVNSVDGSYSKNVLGKLAVIR